MKDAQLSMTLFREYVRNQRQLEGARRTAAAQVHSLKPSEVRVLPQPIQKNNNYRVTFVYQQEHISKQKSCYPGPWFSRAVLWYMTTKPSFPVLIRSFNV